MIVDPYRRNPAAPTVAVLLEDGSAVGEHGDVLDLDDWPQGYVLFASYATVYRLVREGRGEALCWRGEEIRWRHTIGREKEWTRRPGDAAVIKLPFEQLPPDRQLRAFALWRDWLASYGASPTGTSGSASMSLLRARLERRLVTSSGERPPLRFTLGGRQLVGPAGRGSFAGPLSLLDLPAAYARTLAGLRYGGVWLRAGEGEGRRLERFAGSDHPVFVRARVRIPMLAYGPLVRRPRRPPRSFLEASLLGAEYPTGTELQGLWTWEEVAAARSAGCSVRILDAWVHRSGWRPFAPWWDAVEVGRSMGGLSGQLAKMVGNALWGRFAMDPSLGAVRQIRSMGKKRLEARPLPSRPAPYPAHDLAETVSGRVRATLWGGLMRAGEAVVSAHTDGMWVQPPKIVAGNPIFGVWEDDGWREKDRARRLDLLGPQALRYWPVRRPRDAEPFYVYAGVPAEVAPAMFERKWEKAGLSARGPVNA